MARTSKAVVALLAFALFAACVTADSKKNKSSKNKPPLRAFCRVGFGDAKGFLMFEQPRKGGPTKISGFVKNVTEGAHGWHIHEAKIDPEIGCASALGHFNPNNRTHGAPENDEEDRHIGDLGNFFANKAGFARIDVTDRLLSLKGKNRVIGRSIVIHGGEDDLGLGVGDAEEGSLAAGNSGPRVGCCVIEKLF